MWKEICTECGNSFKDKEFRVLIRVGKGRNVNGVTPGKVESSHYLCKNCARSFNLSTIL